jgi:chemotaxis regulatin CheY-phosphate phosphatase CheZ
MADEENWILAEDRRPTAQQLLFEEAHKRSMELVKRIEHMMLTVVKTQVIIESFMIELLEAHGRDPQRFFYTGKKIEECKDKINPPEVGQPIWELLTLCSHVRNELVHSLNTEKIKEKSEKARQAYAAITPEGPRRQDILNANDTDVVADALRHCGGYIVIATEAKVAADKKAKTTSG